MNPHLKTSKNRPLNPLKLNKTNLQVSDSEVVLSIHCKYCGNRCIKNGIEKTVNNATNVIHVKKANSRIIVTMPMTPESKHHRPDQGRGGHTGNGTFVGDIAHHFDLKNQENSFTD